MSAVPRLCALEISLEAGAFTVEVAWRRCPAHGYLVEVSLHHLFTSLNDFQETSARRLLHVEGGRATTTTGAPRLDR